MKYESAKEYIEEKVMQETEEEINKLKWLFKWLQRRNCIADYFRDGLDTTSYATLQAHLEEQIIHVVKEENIPFEQAKK